jgi:hypothetical protein
MSALGSKHPGGGRPPDEGAIQHYVSRLITRSDLVKRAVATGTNITVTLVRGCTVESGLKAMNTMTAGGLQPNPTCGAPSHSEAISQVGGSAVGRPQQKLPEFTATGVIATKWARRGGWLLIKIKTKYLTLGDPGQDGWMCRHAAPLEWAQFIGHPNPKASALPNAD